MQPGMGTGWVEDGNGSGRVGTGGVEVGREHEVNVEFVKSETLVGMDPDGSQPRSGAGRQSRGTVPLWQGKSERGGQGPGNGQLVR